MKTRRSLALVETKSCLLPHECCVCVRGYLNPLNDEPQALVRKFAREGFEKMCCPLAGRRVESAQTEPGGHDAGSPWISFFAWRSCRGGRSAELNAFVAEIIGASARAVAR